MTSGKVFTTVSLLQILSLVTSQDENCTSTCSTLLSSPHTTVCFEIHCLPFLNEETEILNIAGSTLEDIPENAFLYLTNLTQIHIADCTIGTLKSYSFNATYNIIDIFIHHSHIRTIESSAFGKSTFANGGKLNTYQLLIGTIESFAFDGISDLEGLTFYATNITTIESKAFYKISSCESFQIYHSTITNLRSLALDGFTEMKNVRIFSCTIMNLERNTLEAFQSDMGSDFMFFYISVDCVCDITWLFSVKSFFPDFPLNGIGCTMDSVFEGATLDTLNVTDICQASETEDTKIPSTEISETITTPNVDTNTTTELPNPGTARLMPASVTLIHCAVLASVLWLAMQY
ncbi:chondroadherin-like [Haliotis asinina]|uniref:chondroadherin-like n=1 Tax=Haliotis asinina TaxID=109174 RepID=UPI003531E2D5